jgi:hypothetical protein
MVSEELESGRIIFFTFLVIIFFFFERSSYWLPKLSIIIIVRTLTKVN